jgi:Mg2+/Co2+ transporter CorB
VSDAPLGALVALLIGLIFLSACFSGSETAMMALNRYRLRHLARHGHGGAKIATRLLDRPDRLIGLILLGNNFVNIMATSVATIIALRVLGEAGIAVVPFVLTVVILIFAEVAPKTVAALYPERLAFPAARVLSPLLKLTYPFVAAINWVTNGLLRLLGFDVSASDGQNLSREELRTIVDEAGTVISRRHQRMLTSILDLERVTVDDIMVPRQEITGVDLADPIEQIVELLLHSQHTRLPLYESDIDQLSGMLHLRRVLAPLARGDLTKERLRANAADPYFVPAGTPLHTQLRNFQHQGERIGLVVDEYGDIDGLVTLEDLLEEIVGEFTTDPAALSADIHPQPDGTYLVDGSANIRELNRAMRWDLPTEGPKTLNGLVLEYLESIPEAGTSLLIAGYPVEIVQASRNAVKTARIKPGQRQPARRRRLGHT